MYRFTPKIDLTSKIYIKIVFEKKISGKVTRFLPCCECGWKHSKALGSAGDATDTAHRHLKKHHKIGFMIDLDSYLETL